MSHAVPTVPKDTAFLPASAPSAISITCGLVEVYVVTPGCDPPRTSAHESRSVPAVSVRAEASNQNRASFVTRLGAVAAHDGADTIATQIAAIAARMVFVFMLWTFLVEVWTCGALAVVRKRKDSKRTTARYG